MAVCKSQSTIYISGQPSCVAFSPENPEYALIGTYELDENPKGEHEAQQRSGSIILYHKSYQDIVIEICSVPTSFGVLDIEFSPHSPSLLCAATSTGSLAFYKLNLHDENSPLFNLTITQVFSQSILVLDLVFHPAIPSIIATTQSDGTVTLLHLTPSYDLMSVQNLYTFSLEAWTCSFSLTGDYLYAGADDASLAIIPLNANREALTQEDDGPAVDFSVQAIKKIHSAGVTSILPLDTNLTSLDNSAQFIITGSYDDHIRVLRIIPGLSAKVVSDENLGGGVWRLKCIETIISDGLEKGCKWIVLASCMYAGSRVVEVSYSIRENGTGNGDDLQWNIKVLSRFEEHESMNYGSDVVPLSTEQKDRGIERTRSILSTSFYDKRVCIWNTDFTPITS